MSIPFFDAHPMPLKNESGTDITKAQGQETTRKFNALIIQSVKLPLVTNGGMNASATAEKTTAGV